MLSWKQLTLSNYKQTNSMVAAQTCSPCIWRAPGQLVVSAVAAVVDRSCDFWQQCQGFVPLGSLTAQTAGIEDLQLNWEKWVITPGCTCSFVRVHLGTGNGRFFLQFITGVMDTVHLVFIFRDIIFFPTPSVLQIMYCRTDSVNVKAHFTRVLCQASLVSCSHLHSWLFPGLFAWCRWFSMWRSRRQAFYLMHFSCVKAIIWEMEGGRLETAWRCDTWIGMLLDSEVGGEHSSLSAAIACHGIWRECIY